MPEADAHLHMVLMTANCIPARGGWSSPPEDNSINVTEHEAKNWSDLQQAIKASQSAASLSTHVQIVLSYRTTDEALMWDIAQGLEEDHFTTFNGKQVNVQCLNLPFDLIPLPHQPQS